MATSMAKWHSFLLLSLLGEGKLLLIYYDLLGLKKKKVYTKSISV